MITQGFVTEIQHLFKNKQTVKSCTSSSCFAGGDGGYTESPWTSTDAGDGPILSPHHDGMSGESSRTGLRGCRGGG